MVIVGCRATIVNVEGKRWYIGVDVGRLVGTTWHSLYVQEYLIRVLQRSTEYPTLGFVTLCVWTMWEGTIAHRGWLELLLESGLASCRLLHV